MLLIDKLSYSSRLRYKSPCIKSIFAISVLLSCILMHSILFSSVTIILMGSLTVFAGGTSLKYYMKLLKLPVIFLILSTVTIIFEISSNPVAAPALHLFNTYIYITADNLYMGLNLIVTAFGGVSCLYFLALSTPFSDLLYVLKAARCPSLLIELLLLIYRFIFVLYDMAAALNIAQESRLVTCNFKTRLRGSVSLFETLFIRAIKKSSYLYDAMESRCYDGTIKVLNETKRATKVEIMFLLLCEAVLIIFYFIQRSYLGI
jgi:cobalt/nickel transport system permease protein